MPYVKNKIAVNVPRRSGFDKSHRHSGSLNCGTITPLLFDEVIPGSRVSLRINIASQLPPLVSDTYMNVKLKTEAFFVPLRLLCASFEDFFCDFPRRSFLTVNVTDNQSSGAFGDVVAGVPRLALAGSSTVTIPMGPGSLLDYLGMRVSQPASSTTYVSALPLVCYHLVWQEWYRQPRVQNPAFASDLGATSDRYANVVRGATLPFTYFHRATAISGVSVADNCTIPVSSSTQLSSLNCADGVSLFSLRQRNFGLDYFTGARLSAQQGSPAAVDIAIPAGTDASGGSTSFSIAQLRAMNSIQQFRERNNISSPRMVEQVRARYNANLSDGVAQRPICIGFGEYDVNSRGVDQTAPSTAVSPGVNPFSAVGAQYGRAYASGSDFIIEDFTANEPGYILVNVTLVPDCTYSTGTPRLFSRYLSVGSITDMACSLLQNVGDQPIYDNEISDAGWSPGGSVFGYQDRYGDFMYMPNRCSGLLRDGQSLDTFVVQRSFNVGPTLNTQFLEIPTTFLDQVLQVPSTTSGLSAWFDSMLVYKVSMPLAEFSIPSLQDPAYEHGERVVLRRNGQVF